MKLILRKIAIAMTIASSMGFTAKSLAEGNTFRVSGNAGKVSGAPDIKAYATASEGRVFENVVVSQEYGEWGDWSTLSESCINGTPLATTINWGVQFDQTADCTDSLQRERSLFDVYTDNSKVFVELDYESSTQESSRLAQAVGTKDAIASSYYGSWRSYGSWSSCSGGRKYRSRYAPKYFIWESGRTTSVYSGVVNTQYADC
jgi:hypothetical protein